MPLLCDDLLQVRAPTINFYVLRATDGLYLLDGGFIGGRSLLRRALRRHGWESVPIRGIVVTHGHLDHVVNVAPIAEETGAWVAAPRLDEPHYRGAYPYTGVARVCGALEAVGRVILGYRTFKVDRWLEDGDQLDLWHGLETVHLPGHTVGHCGFYCRKLKLLFSGDLFASYTLGPRIPPAIFNSLPALIPASVNKALALEPEGIWPNHCDRRSAEVHLARLRRVQAKL